MSVMTSSAPVDGADGFTASPAEIALTSDQFKFVFHSNPERFFRGSRPYRLFQTKPALTTYSDVIYTPAVRGGPKLRLGCLYDEGLNRIDDSMTYRNRNDDLFNMDPEQYSGNTADLPVYERPVLYMGHLRPHFGHFIMETLANWWALTEDLGDVDRFLFHVADPGLLERSYIKASLDAMQINRDNLLTFDEPTRLRKVLVPHSSFQLHSHIYAKYKDIVHQLARNLGVEDAKTTDQPVFLSRSMDTHGVRRYVGQEKVEAFLSDRGVRIVYPNQLSFADQLKVVNEHQLLLGFQGSQLHNIVGALEPKTVIYLTDRRPWGCCFLMSQCLNYDATFVMASEAESKSSKMIRAAKKKITGKKTFKEGFQISHQVDVEKTIGWLKTSGLV